MKITEGISKNARAFEDINEGDVFYYEGGYYMKIIIPKNMNNAVDLNDGEALFFDDNKWVTLVDHELVIK